MTNEYFELPPELPNLSDCWVRPVENKHVPQHLELIARRIWCRVVGHDFYEEDYIDSHNNWDSICRCRRCKEYF